MDFCYVHSHAHNIYKEAERKISTLHIANLLNLVTVLLHMKINIYNYNLNDTLDRLIAK